MAQHSLRAQSFASCFKQPTRGILSILSYFRMVKTQGGTLYIYRKGFLIKTKSTHTRPLTELHQHSQSQLLPLMPIITINCINTALLILHTDTPKTTETAIMTTTSQINCFRTMNQILRLPELTCVG